jgi:transposase-like protein
MLSIIPRIFPDELFYSWFSRYHRFSGNSSPVITMIELFNKKNSKLNIHFPFCLEFLIEQFPENLLLTSDDIINKHTIFPYLRLFMRSDCIDNTIEAMKYDIKQNIPVKTTINTQKIFDINIIKICPKCYIEDREMFGEAYIHRTHQVPGNLICIKHMQYLVNYKIPDNISTNEFIDINKCEINFNDKNINISKEIINLSKDISYILNLHDMDLHIDVIKEKYNLMIERNMYKFWGSSNQKIYVQKFIDYYSSEFLQKLNSSSTLEEHTNWIKHLINKSKVNVNPIRHMLFIRFLAGSAESFIECKRDLDYFGTGPWPCLNPISSHYKELIIQNCSVKKEREKISGVFKCDFCGYTYSKKIKNNMYETNRIVEYGYVWEEKLKQLLKQSKSISEITDIMKCSSNTVKRYGQSFGVFALKYNHNKNRRNINNDDGRLLEYRKRINDYIDNNRDKNRSQIRKALVKEYCYLQKRDRSWLEDILPPKAAVGEQLTNVVNWNEIDDRLEQLVPKVIKEILEDEKIIRITYYSISKRCKMGSLRKEEILKKMPKTRKIIMDNLETAEEFKKRKIRRCIELLIKNGEKINKTQILRKISLKEEYKQLKPFIERYLKELNANH